MKLRHRRKRGTVGVEAAIVLIAFVIVASAIAYVVINMGFYASQRTKDTIEKGIAEATSALELDGTVIAKTDNSSAIKYIVFPVKLSVGRSRIDLSQNATVVSVYSNWTLLNIYQGVNHSFGDPTDFDTITSSFTSEGAIFIIYNDDGDDVLELHEKAFLVLCLNTTDHKLGEYQTVKIEVRTGQGAALTVVREIPGGLPSDDYVDLG